MVTPAPVSIDHAEVAARHRVLCALADRLDPRDIEAILVLGAAVVLHGHLEPCHLRAALDLVDPAVARAMAADHRRLAENLDYLAELSESDPGSPDVEVLAGAILERLCSHLQRDSRALYAPTARLQRVLESGA